MPADPEVRACIESLTRALSAKDIDALMAHYAPDVAVFDLMPLQLTGADAYRRNFEAWFGAVRGPIGFEIRDLDIVRTGDVAFCHYEAMRHVPARVCSEIHVVTHVLPPSAEYACSSRYDRGVIPESTLRPSTVRPSSSRSRL